MRHTHRSARHHRPRTLLPALLCAACVLLALVSRASGAGGNTATATLTLSVTESASLSQSESVSETASVSTSASASVSTTRSQSLSATETLTPSDTFSTSLSATYTGTDTDTFTPTFTVSTSATDTLSLTATESLSETESIQHHANYTISTGPLLYDVVEGQEFRMRFEAIFPTPSGGARYLSHFNVTDESSLQTAGFAFDAQKDDNCSAYLNDDTGRGTTFWHTHRFGVSDAAHARGLRFVRAAYVTATAPRADTAFVICFKHRLDPERVSYEANDLWQMLTYEHPTTGRTTFVHRSSRSGVFYHIPPPVTAGQYAVIKLMSDEAAWNFTAAASTCIECGTSDSLKLVPQGVSCTQERQRYEAPYYGSSFVAADGAWEATAGLTENAMLGGAGVVSTASANPYVDATTGGATAFAASPGESAEKKTAFAYVMLPTAPGAYDVCFSSTMQRADVAAFHNATLHSIPVWRKINGCPTPECFPLSAAWAAGGYGAPAHEYPPSTLSTNSTTFTVSAETLAWSSEYMEPASWGTLRVAADDTASLNRMPHVANTHWLPLGGGAVKAVPARFFPAGEWDDARPEASSFAREGCWADARAWASDSEPTSDRVQASSDLDGGDLQDASWEADRTAANESYAFMYYDSDPNATYFVCYREGYYPSATAAAATALDQQRLAVPGWRVLPFAAPASVSGYPHARLLQAGWHGDANATEPSAWSMNDTREGTWGGLRLAHPNTTGVPVAGGARTHRKPLDGPGGGVAVRLVPAGLPCAWNAAAAWKGAGLAAESLAAGQAECPNYLAENDTARCMGSADVAVGYEHVMYLTMPLAARSPYRVCVRYGDGNWRVAEPGLLHVEAPSNLTVEVGGGGVLRAGVEAHLVVRDNVGFACNATLHGAGCEGGTLAVAGRPHDPSLASCPQCVSTGDVLRIVPRGATCGINPTNWVASEADTTLSVACESVYGAGLRRSEPCRSLATRADGRRGRVSSLAEFERAVTHPYDDVVPGDPVAYGVPTAVAALVAPPAGGGGGSANEYTLCYRQLARENWLVLNATLRVVASDDAAPVVTFPPDASADLVGGYLQRFEVHVPPLSGATSVGGHHGRAWLPGGAGSGAGTAGITVGSQVVIPADAPAAIAGKLGFVLRYVAPSSAADADPTVWVVAYAEGGAWGRETWDAPAYEALDQRVVPGVEWVGAASLLTAAVAADLLAGNYTEPLRSVGRFRAKLVPDRGLAGYANAGCLDAPAGTAAAPYAAGTRYATAGSTEDRVAFRLITPQRQGFYHLCLQLTEEDADGLFWHRLGPYHVRDNGVRWAAAQAPSANAVVDFTLRKCAFDPATGGCGGGSVGGLRAAFDASPGADAAKVVRYDEACFDEGLLAGAAAPAYAAVLRGHGASRSVDKTYDALGRGGARAADLGPADGVVAEATFRTTFPAAPATERYKVCVQTAVPPSPHRPSSVWVEVEADKTRPSADPFELAVPPSPVASFGVAAAAVVLPSTAAHTFPAVYGGTVTDRGSAEEAALVLDPPPQHAAAAAPWATGGVRVKFVRAGGGDCAGSAGWEVGVGFLQGGGVAADGRSVRTALPHDAALYAVCVRLRGGGAEVPWLQLEGRDSTAAAAAEAASLRYSGFAVRENPLTFAPAENEVVAYDSAADPVGSTSLSSWCAPSAAFFLAQLSGANCTAFSGRDTIIVANATQACPPPDAFSTSSAAAPFTPYALAYRDNVTAAVSAPSQGFRLPPAYPSPTATYKVCLLKGGDLRGDAGASVAKRDSVAGGVVYMLRNRGTERVGGGTPYYEPATLIDGLDVQVTNLVVNDTLHFTRYDSAAVAERYGLFDTSVRLSGADANEGSHTPLVATSDVLEVSVRPTSGGRVLPHGSFAVHVRHCAPAVSWSDLSCPAPRPFTSAAPAFALGGVSSASSAAAGACDVAGARAYAWDSVHPGGLQQFLRGGVAVFRLQFGSACPDGQPYLNAGCGLVFEGVPDGARPGVLQVPYTAVRSSPLWLNVRRRAPDGVAVNGTWLSPQAVDGQTVAGAAGATAACSGGGGGAATPLPCRVLRCWHGRPCRVEVAARRGGPREAAPAGFLRVARHGSDTANPLVVDLASFGAASAQPQRDLLWATGGVYYHDFTPRLLDDSADSVRVCVNVTTVGVDSGGGDAAAAFAVATSSAYCIDVVRRLPARLNLVSVRRVDTRTPGGVSPPDFEVATAVGGRDALLWASAGGGAASSLTAAEGSYLMSLAPYELLYTVADADGVLLGADDLATPRWDLAVGSVGDTFPVLPVADDGGGGGGARHSFLATANDTAGRHAAAPPQPWPGVLDARESVAAAAAGGAAGHPVTSVAGRVFATRFRVLHNRGCVRAVAGAAGRCELSVVLSRRSSPQAVHAVVAAPIRVPATALLVEEASALSTGAAPMSTGLVLRVVPGSRVDGAFYADEFHRGELFASVFAAPASAAATPAASVAASATGPRVVASSNNNAFYGALLAVRLDRPCVRCEVVVQSTWGAVDEGGRRAVNLTDDTAALAVAAEAEAAWLGNETESQPVAIRVRAVAATGAATGWADWNLTVPTTTASGTYAVVVDSPGGGATPQSPLRLEHGEATVVVRFRRVANGTGMGSGGTAAEMLTFAATVQAYRSDVRGSVPVEVPAGANATVLSGNVTVAIRGVPVAKPSLRMRAVSVTNSAAVGGPAAVAAREGAFVMSTAVTECVVTMAVEHAGTEHPDLPDAPAAVAQLTAHVREIGADNFGRARAVASQHADAVGSDGTVYTYGSLRANFSRPVFAVVGGEVRASFTLSFETFLRGTGSLVPSMVSPFSDVRLSVCLRNETVAAAGLTWWASCGQVRLWSLPHEDTIVYHPTLRVVVISETVRRGAPLLSTTPHVAVVADTTLTPGCAVQGFACGGAADVSTLTVTAAVVYAWRNLTVVSSTAPYLFQLTHAGTNAPLVDADAWAGGDLRETTVLQRGNALQGAGYAVPYAGSSTAHAALEAVAAALRPLAQASGPATATFTFTGTTALATRAAFEVAVPRVSGVEKPASPHARNVAVAETRHRYSWGHGGAGAAPQAPYSTWRVLDAVAHDDECPGKRRLQATDAATRQRVFAEGPPGLGWRYAGGAAAGVPFPVQTLLAAAGGGRAWAAPELLVRVVRRAGGGGCNDGGELRLYDLRASERLAGGTQEATGSVAESLVRVTTGRLRKGVSTTWVALAEPCEACRLELSLCYASARIPADCLTGTPDADGPVLAERVQLTKPFSVRRRAPRLSLVSQRAPATGDAMVGDTFEVEWQAVVEAASSSTLWAFAAANASVLHAVRSVWAGGGGGGSALYGRGGFLADGTGAACSGAASAAAGAVGGFAAASAAGTGVFAFHFARPCSGGCAVVIDSVVDGVPQPPLVLPGGPWRVHACPHAYALFGFPPGTVQRRRPFSVTAGVVDNAGHPVLATAVPPPQVSAYHRAAAFLTGRTAPALLALEKGGNGGGGAVLWAAAAGHGGLATTVLLEYDRACFLCRATVRGRPHTVVVGSEAARYVAQRVRSLPRGGVSFDMFVSDAEHNRAMTAWGTTFLLYQPMYGQGAVRGGNVSVYALPPDAPGSGADAPAYPLLCTVSDAGGAPQTAQLTLGAGSAVVAVDEVVYNGLPVSPTHGWRVGAVTARVVRGLLPAYYRLGVGVGGDRRAAEGVQGRGVLVRGGVGAAAVEALAAAPGGVVGARQHEVTALSVYAVASADAAASPPAYVLAGVAEGALVKAVWACDSCGGGGGGSTCPHELPVEAVFGEFGRAVFRPVFRAFDACSVTFAHGAAANVTARVSVQGDALPARWAWAPTATLALAAGAAADPAANESRAHGAAGHPVSLLLQAYGADPFAAARFVPSNAVAWSAGAAAAPAVLVSPAGCFVAASPAAAVRNGSAVRVQGVFHEEPLLAAQGTAAAAAPPCNVTVVGLPGARAASPALLVATRTMARATLRAGHPKRASLAEPFVIEGSVVDARGRTVLGDQQTTIVALDAADERRSVRTGPPAVVRDGLFSVAVTLNATAAAAGVALVFYAPGGSVAASTVLSGVEVRRVPNRVAVEVQLGGRAAPWTRFEDGATLPWVLGYSFSLRLTVVDGLGGRMFGVGGGGGGGEEVVVSVVPTTAPCLSVEGSPLFREETGVVEPLVAATCAGRGGACVGLEPPVCAPLSAAFGYLGDPRRPEKAAGFFPVAAGQAYVQDLAYAGGAAAAGADGGGGGGDGGDDAEPVGFRVDAQGLVHASLHLLRFQALRGFALEGRWCVGGTCRLREGDGAAPAGGGGNGGGGVWANVTAERAVLDPESAAPDALRAKPGVAFDLRVQLVDGAGQPVAGDGSSVVRVSAACADVRSPRFFLGTAGGLDGSLVERGAPGWDEAVVSGGGATFRGLAFSTWCASARLVLRCVASPEVDTLRACLALRAETDPFEVGATAVAPSPAPAVPPGVGGPRAWLDVGDVRPLAGVAFAAFEEALHGAVQNASLDAPPDTVPASDAPGLSASLLAVRVAWACRVGLADLRTAGRISSQYKQHTGACLHRPAAAGRRAEAEAAAAAAQEAAAWCAGGCTTVFEIAFAMADPADFAAMQAVSAMVETVLADPTAAVYDQELVGFDLAQGGGLAGSFTPTRPPTAHPGLPAPTPLVGKPTHGPIRPPAPVVVARAAAMASPPPCCVLLLLMLIHVTAVVAAGAL